MSDLHNQGRTEELLDRAYAALGTVLDRIVILRVTTVVGTVTAASVGDPAVLTTISVAPEGQRVAHSAVNMALGDMDVVMSKEFLDDPALMTLHNQALTDSRAIRKDSVELLRAAIEGLIGRGSA